VPPLVFICWLIYLVSERPCNRLVARLRSGERAPATVSGP